MANRREGNAPPTSLNSPDWAAVGIGIMTIATIIAAAIAAAGISVVRGNTDEDATPVTVIAAAAAAGSLSVYYLVIVIGLSALFPKSQPEREQKVVLSAVMLIIQTGVGVAFAIVAILGPILVGAG